MKYLIYAAFSIPLLMSVNLFGMKDSKDNLVQVGLVFDEGIKRHDMGAGHPESAQRIEWILAGLKAHQVWPDLIQLPAREATDKQLEAAHTKAHVQRFHLDAAKTEKEKATITAARLAAGSTLAACDAVMEKKVRRAFSIVRPPGHHAGPETAEGFCFFNNVAVAARYLQSEYALKRILILDWDVHAGNGTYAMFQDDPTVYDVHVHQDPATIYPGTGFAHEKGIGKGLGFSANFTLPPRSTGADVQKVLDQDVAKIIREFRPEFILISAGFDMHKADPLGSFTVTSEDYARFTRTMVELAEEVCGGRIVSVLEGGYSKEALHDGVALHVKALLQEAQTSKATKRREK